MCAKGHSSRHQHVKLSQPLLSDSVCEQMTKRFVAVLQTATYIFPHVTATCNVSALHATNVQGPELLNAAVSAVLTSLC